MLNVKTLVRTAGWCGWYVPYSTQVEVQNGGLGWLAPSKTVAAQTTGYVPRQRAEQPKMDYRTTPEFVISDGTVVVAVRKKPYILTRLR